MRVEVRMAAGSAWPWEEGGRVVVIDVLRATTSMVTALAGGCRAIIPLSRPEEALALKKDGLILAGEQGGVKIPGFDLGNSPLEFTTPRVGGRTLAMVTTNGTAAVLEAASFCGEVLVAAFINATAVARKLLQGEGDIVISCAGREGRFSLEDFAAAGLLVQQLMAARPGLDPGDMARAACATYRHYSQDIEGMLCQSGHGRTLAALGFTRDLAFCARLDLFDLAPRLLEGEIVAT